MKISNPFVLPGVLAALVVSSQAPAAAATHQCSQLWDDTLRLGCYDTAFGKPHPPAGEVASAATVAPAAPAAAAVAPAVPAAVAGAAVVGAAAAPAASAAPHAASAPAATAVPAPAAKEKAKSSEPVKSVVTTVDKTLDGRFRVTLENGEVWQQLELYPAVQVKLGEQVTLRHASLGSMQLVTSVGLAARVTQIK
jgi:hypothetical protein